MRKKIVYSFIILFVGFTAFILYRLHLVAEGKPFRDGVAAMKEERYADAIEKFRPLAESGNLRARVYMAQFYTFGLGVTADNDAAQKWLSCDGIEACVNGELEYAFAYEFSNEADLRHFDMNKARYLMELSSRKGYQKADIWLAKNTGN
jgi:TPR repeat protein